MSWSYSGYTYKLPAELYAAQHVNWKVRPCLLIFLIPVQSVRLTRNIYQMSPIKHKRLSALYSQDAQWKGWHWSSLRRTGSIGDKYLSLPWSVPSSSLILPASRHTREVIQAGQEELPYCSAIAAPVASSSSSYITQAPLNSWYTFLLRQYLRPESPPGECMLVSLNSHPFLVFFWTLSHGTSFIHKTRMGRVCLKSYCMLVRLFLMHLTEMCKNRFLPPQTPPSHSLVIMPPLPARAFWAEGPEEGFIPCSSLSLCAWLPNAELENLYTLRKATYKLKLHFILLCACVVSANTTNAKKLKSKLQWVDL